VRRVPLIVVVVVAGAVAGAVWDACGALDAGEPSCAIALRAAEKGTNKSSTPNWLAHRFRNRFRKMRPPL